MHLVLFLYLHLYKYVPKFRAVMLKPYLRFFMGSAPPVLPAAVCKSSRAQFQDFENVIYGFLVLHRNWITEGVAKHRNRLPREVEESPSLQMLKKQVDMALHKA